jgi:hypothetical protein
VHKSLPLAKMHGRIHGHDESTTQREDRIYIYIHRHLVAIAIKVYGRHISFTPSPYPVPLNLFGRFSLVLVGVHFMLVTRASEKLTGRDAET